jgi:hypothetical protein
MFRIKLLLQSSGYNQKKTVIWIMTNVKISNKISSNFVDSVWRWHIKADGENRPPYYAFTLCILWYRKEKETHWGLMTHPLNQLCKAGGVTLGQVAMNYLTSRAINMKADRCNINAELKYDALVGVSLWRHYSYWRTVIGCLINLHRPNVSIPTYKSDGTHNKSILAERSTLLSWKLH